VIGLNETVDKYRPTQTTNPEGEEVFTWPDSPTESDIPCRVVTVSLARKAQMEAIGLHYGDVEAYTFLFEDGKDIATDDKLEYDGEYYRVLTVEDPDKLGHHLEVLAVHVEGITS